MVPRSTNRKPEVRGLARADPARLEGPATDSGSWAAGEQPGHLPRGPSRPRSSGTDSRAWGNSARSPSRPPEPAGDGRLLVVRVGRVHQLAAGAWRF